MVYRLFSILIDLLSHEKLTAKYLANKYCVSERTIMRDVDNLSLSGIPIICKKGNNGGILISDDFKLRTTLISDKEKDFLAGLATQIKNENQLQTYQGILNKLKSGYSAPAIATTKGVIIDASSSAEEKIVSKITAFENAINNYFEVEITYFDHNLQTTTRIIHPLNFVTNNNQWYIYCYCTLRKQFRVFKLSRIGKMHILKSKFSPYTNYQKNWKFDFNENKTSVNLVMQVKENARYQMEEWLGIESVKQIGKQNYIAHTTTFLDDDLIFKLLSFGDRIKILEPQIVINRLNEIIDNINYKK